MANRRMISRDVADTSFFTDMPASAQALYFRLVLEADDEGFDLPLQNTKVLSLAFFGPHHLATGGADNLIRLWNLREQREIGRLKGPRGSIAALACRGQWLAAGCFDTTARLWTMADQVASSLEETERAAVRTSR